MSDYYAERFHKDIEKMQSLAKSMEETINQHQNKPELACNKTALKHLTQRAKNLYNEMDDCQNGVDGVTENLIYEKTVAERKIMDCESAIEDAEMEITFLNDSIQDQEKGIRESELQIRNLEEAIEEGNRANRDREENMETSKDVAVGTWIGGAACLAGGILFTPLLIPAAALTIASAGSTVVHVAEKNKGEVDVSEMHDRLRRQQDEKDTCQRQINGSQQSIASNQRDIIRLQSNTVDYEIKINKYREAVCVMMLCKKVLNQWLDFLQSLQLSMNRIEYRFGGDVAIKDTVAYREHLKLIHGFDANQSLKAATQMLQLSLMDEEDVQGMMEQYSIEYEF